MELRALGSSGVEVSVIGLGTMSWTGCLFGESGVEDAAGYAAARDTVATALEVGITLFDTAEGYGRGLAEIYLGRALAELGARERAVIVTKVGPLFAEEQVGGRKCDLSRASVLARCEASLRRLGVDCIDVYLAHWPDPDTPIEETMGAVAELRAAGKIRAFGVSNFSVGQMEAALKHGPVAANQLPYSLADRSIDADRRPFCVEQGIGIMAYSPLGKGVLGGRYSATHLPPPGDYRHQRPHFAAENLPRNLALAERLRELAAELAVPIPTLAIAWVLGQPGLKVALPGAKSAGQVRVNATAGNYQLPPEIRAELDALSASPTPTHAA